MSTNQTNKQDASCKILIGFGSEQKLNKLSQHIVNDKNKFDNYIVAYLDFLGFKERMKEKDSYASLQILKFLLKETEEVANKISNINGIDEFHIKIFSDNIVIAQKTKLEQFDYQIMSIINLIESIQYHALMYFGFLLRGGITIGKLYIDSDVVWGTGLIDAYNIENNIANYPRIILSSELLGVYRKCKKKKSLNLFAFIEKDSDGLWFANFFAAAPNLEMIPAQSERLSRITKQYVNESDKIKLKINWLVDYFNTYCYKYRDRNIFDYEKCKLTRI